MGSAIWHWQRSAQPISSATRIRTSPNYDAYYARWRGDATGRALDFDQQVVGSIPILEAKAA